MKSFFKKVNKLNQGYTIIETMIAVSLFLFIVVSGLGALLNANLLHQKSRDMRSIMDNLSFIMEDMGRNLRTGYNYRCYSVVGEQVVSATVNSPRSCPNGWGIAFEAANGSPSNNNDQWFYYIDSGGKLFKSSLKSSPGPNYIASDFIQLTPDEVKIDTTASGFSILGAEPPNANKQQPFVTIRLVGSITYKNIVTPFSLQTSISQRLIDIK